MYLEISDFLFTFALLPKISKTTHDNELISVSVIQCNTLSHIAMFHDTITVVLEKTKKLTSPGTLHNMKVLIYDHFTFQYKGTSMAGNSSRSSCLHRREVPSVLADSASVRPYFKDRCLSNATPPTTRHSFTARRQALRQELAKSLVCWGNRKIAQHQF